MKRPILPLFFLAFLFGLPSALISSACSGGLSDDAKTADGASSARPRLAKPIVVDASCPIVIDSPPLLESPHVAIDTPVTYNSNPPSSGPHYPIWAAFREYDQPVDRRYYVHDLEHGAVVIAYNCQAAAAPADGGASDAGVAACESTVASLRAAIAALPDDPLCASEGVRVRAILTPDPLLDVPIAAAAWGFIYRAQCLDGPSLVAFLKSNYGQGPESLCANGQSMP